MTRNTIPRVKIISCGDVETIESTVNTMLKSLSDYLTSFNMGDVCFHNHVSIQGVDLSTYSATLVLNFNEGLDYKEIDSLLEQTDTRPTWSNLY